jgi:hypothetical protein
MNTDPCLELSPEQFSLAEVAAKVPLKVPELPENPFLARRYAPVGNTFLNWAGSDGGASADADEADLIDTWELQSMRPGRHTFEVGQLGVASRQNFEAINLERTFPALGDFGSFKNIQVERSSFQSDTARLSGDPFPLQHLDHASDVNLERLDESDLLSEHPNRLSDCDSFQKLSLLDLAINNRPDDFLPTLDRESCQAGHGKLPQRNSFQQRLDSRWTREEDIDENLPWGYTLGSSDYDISISANPVNYTTFDSWQDSDDIDARLPWRDEQHMDSRPQRMPLNDRMQASPTSLAPLRIELSDSLPFAPLQRNHHTPQARNTKVEPLRLQEKSEVKKMIISEGHLVAQEKPVTTLMIRNIPTWYTQEMLLNEWPNDGTYNLLYLPFCFRTKKNLAFAFVNFTRAEYAEAFRERWHKKGLQQHTSRKLLDVSVADVQGQFDTLQKVTKHKSCRIRNAHYQPAIFVNDKRLTVEEYLAFVGPEKIAAS